eukprot:1752774-Amphidinium_carterae.3
MTGKTLAPNTVERTDFTSMLPWFVKPQISENPGVGPLDLCCDLFWLGVSQAVVRRKSSQTTDNKDTEIGWLSCSPACSKSQTIQQYRSATSNYTKYQAAWYC